MVEFKIPAQPAGRRSRNFSEVVIGLNRRQALEQAQLYLQKEVGAGRGEGCPLGTDLFGFARALSGGDIAKAFEIITAHNPFPSVTGRLFPEPVEKLHVFTKSGEPVSVRRLERFVGDNADLSRVKPPAFEKNAPKAAIIGSGPAGLTAAVCLARTGIQSEIFEALSRPGGVWRYGYPAFRLPPEIVDRQVEFVRAHGAEFHVNAMFGPSFFFDELSGRGFQAVLIATGAGLSKPLNVPGQECGGVISGDELLQRMNLLSAQRGPQGACGIIGRKVAVIGDGNTAFDCARSCARLGAQVTLVARGRHDDFKVRDYIAGHAREEGVALEVLTNVIKILGDEKNCARALHCRRFDYADADGTGEWQLTEAEGSDFEIPADTVIVATGHRPNGLFNRHGEQLRLSEDGRVWTRPGSLMTSAEGVFACGNIVDGAGPVVAAMLSAKKAAAEMEAYVKAKV